MCTVAAFEDKTKKIWRKESGLAQTKFFPYLRNIPNDVSECEIVGQNVTTYIILSKIQTLLSVMNLSRTYQKAPILYLIYLIAFLSDLRYEMNFKHLKLLRK